MGKWTELAARLEREAECDISDNSDISRPIVTNVTNVTPFGFAFEPRSKLRPLAHVSLQTRLG